MHSERAEVLYMSEDPSSEPNSRIVGRKEMYPFLPLPLSFLGHPRLDMKTDATRTFFMRRK